MTPRHLPCSRRSFARLAGATLLGGGVQLFSSCGGEDSTGGGRLTLTTRVQAETLTFRNAYDFDVELSRVLVSIGPLRYLEGAPVAQQNLLQRVLGVRVAHAHPGHYVAGGVLGEMLVPTSVDLATGASLLGAAPGVSGLALSAQFSFQSPPTGPFAEDLDGNLVVLEGEAQNDTLSRSFRAVGRVGDVVNDDGELVILGCQFEGGELTRDGVVDLVIRPSVWLDQVDFSELPKPEDEEPIELEPSTRPHRAFVRGLLKASAYHFGFTPELR